MKRILVLGAGGFGFAIAYVLAKAGHAVTLWDRNTGAVEGEWEMFGCNRYKWMRPLPPCHNITYVAGEIKTAGYDFVPIATSMAGLPDVVAQLNLPETDAPVIVTMQKGLDNKFQIPPLVVLDRWPNATTLHFTGAGFAQDIAEGQQTLMAIGYAYHRDVEFAIQPGAQQASERFRDLFRGTNVWPTVTHDIRGLCACGAARTVASLLWGIVDGLFEAKGVIPQTTVAAAAAGIESEYWRLLVLLGTFGGSVFDLGSDVHRVALADLMLCRSAGRNWDFGRRAGRGERPKMTSDRTVEGARNLGRLYSMLAYQPGQFALNDFPYLGEAYGLIYLGWPIKRCLESILDRHGRRFQ